MNCPRCEHENETGARFCEECAAPLGRACAHCGRQLSLTAKFCPECAHPTALPGAPPPTHRFGSPESYTPKYLAEKILTSKAALEGERKQVTVLFADLKSSMELLADRDPEEARKILDPVIERMMEAVHRYEGTVNQVMGDGIMALFGAPLAHEDHVVRACYAALRMQESVKTYAEAVRRSHGAVVKIRVGLNSGEVVVRSIGSDLHMDYTAVGQTTHLAARMEQLADPGAIVMTPDTLRLAEGYVEVKSLGQVPVKGLAEPVEVYELIRAGTARTRLQVAALRGLTRFAGRDAEVEHLRRVLGQAGAGRGQVVAIVGEAGVGKSRLVYEFTHSHRVQDWQILQASSVSYGKATSYLPVIDLLKSYFKIGAEDDHREMRARVLGRVLGLDGALEPLLPPLLALLDVPVEDASWRNLGAPERRQLTLDAVKRLLLRESQAQPLLVVFEDLHWVDSGTQALLDSLVDSLGSARLLLLVNYRPEYEHRWGSRTAYSQIRLDTLPAVSAAEMLGTLLGPDPELTPLTQMLVKRGNPFFLEEMVRALVETGALVGTPGAYRLTRPVEALRVPATVQTILVARIDRLPSQEKELLQAASVIGKDVPYALLAEIAGQSEEALRRGLAHLQETEFLHETQLSPNLEYTFKHALTHEVTYGGLLHDRRRVLHARVLRAMEHARSSRLSLQIEQLAHHALRGEEWARAAQYLHLAGRRAIAQGRYASGVGFYEAAIRALDQQGGDADLTLKLDAYLELGTARTEGYQLEGYRELMDQAEALARMLDDRERLAQVRVRQAQGLWNLWSGPSNFEDAIERARAASALAAPDDLRTRSYAQFLVGAASLALGRFHHAVQEFDAGVALFTAVPADAEAAGLVLPIRANLRAWQAEAYAALGDFGPAVAAAGEARRIADELCHPQTQGLAGVHAGYVLLLQGRIEAAAAAFESGLSSGRTRTWNFLGLALAHFLLGRYDDGQEALARGLEVGGDPFGPQGKIVSRYGVIPAAAYLAAGRLEDAEAAAAQGLALATMDNARAYHVPLGRLRAEALTLQGKGPASEEALLDWGRLIELAKELSMRPEIAHCSLRLGKLYGRLGDRTSARKLLTTAVTMYRDMAMGFWLEEGEAALEQVG